MLKILAIYRSIKKLILKVKPILIKIANFVLVFFKENPDQ